MWVAERKPDEQPARKGGGWGRDRGREVQSPSECVGHKFHLMT